MQYSEAINLGRRLFIDSDGTVHPIAVFLDFEGGECGIDDACFAIAGAGERWFAIDLEDFECDAPVH